MVDFSKTIYTYIIICFASEVKAGLRPFRRDDIVHIRLLSIYQPILA